MKPNELKQVHTIQSGPCATSTTQWPAPSFPFGRNAKYPDFLGHNANECAAIALGTKGNQSMQKLYFTNSKCSFKPAVRFVLLCDYTYLWLVLVLESSDETLECGNVPVHLADVSDGF